MEALESGADGMVRRGSRMSSRGKQRSDLFPQENVEMLSFSIHSLRMFLELVLHPNKEVTPEKGRHGIQMGSSRMELCPEPKEYHSRLEQEGGASQERGLCRTGHSRDFTQSWGS